MEATYRNPLPEVQRFFNTRHGGHYKIYNLCAERGYDLTGLFHKVKRFPFMDHNTCPFELLSLFCQSVDEFLNEDPRNVVGIHCKAGKGRTGLAIAVYLLHSGFVNCANEGLIKFAIERTLDGKGVTIPSQMRYAHYYEQNLLSPKVNTPVFQLLHVRMLTVPNFDAGLCGFFSFFSKRYKKNLVPS